MFFEFTISDQHPALSGHFPGRPIVPAALLIDELSRRIAQDLDQMFCCAKQVRFVAAIKPNETIKVEYTSKNLHEVRFQCSVAGEVVTRGLLSTQIDYPVPDLPLSGEAGHLINIDDLYQKLPHGGSMCLLDHIDSFDRESIHCVSVRSSNNPLSREGQLSSWASLEYAGQGFACHGLLNAVPDVDAGVDVDVNVGPQNGSGPKEIPRAWVIGIKYLVCYRQFLPELDQDLTVFARIIAHQQGAASYQFSLSADNKIFSFGQVNVAFDLKD
ncbi:MAG: hypothetical protein KUG71_11080 [Porticoccaceae bacterium]|nr:hypothetical protein [Porticoccaceae bacterium]